RKPLASGAIASAPALARLRRDLSGGRRNHTPTPLTAPPAGPASNCGLNLSQIAALMRRQRASSQGRGRPTETDTRRRRCGLVESCAMRSARQSAIRLLQLMMVASVVLPLVLFAFAAWLNYRHELTVADDRIERSLDILHEHTLKVFQTVERAIAEVDEIVRGMPDDEIREQQPRLHERVKRIVDALPQLRAIFLIDRDGQPLVSSLFVQVPPDLRSRERSFYSAHIAGDVGTFVSEVVAPRLAEFGAPFFVLSRPRPSDHGAFNGVIAVAVLPQYFAEFYKIIGRGTAEPY